MPQGLYKWTTDSRRNEFTFTFIASSSDIKFLQEACKNNNFTYSIEMSKHDDVDVDPLTFELITEDVAFISVFEEYECATMKGLVSDMLQHYDDTIGCENVV